MSIETSMLAASLTETLTKSIYDDLLGPVVKSMGQAIDRGVKAVLWSAAQKLTKIPPERRKAPESNVVASAAVAIACSVDSDDIRDMFTNLLANSMDKAVKDGVHPSFVEIIKQLCPDEARILKHLALNKTIPTIGVAHIGNAASVDIVSFFSDIEERTDCERPDDIEMYFANLVRLGLVEKSPQGASLIYKKLYEPLKRHPKIIQAYKAAAEIENVSRAEYIEGYCSLTDFGKSFCQICLTPPQP